MKKLMLAVFLLGSTMHAYSLQPGESVPDISLQATSGENLSLTDFSDAWVVLYFYPRSFTPGCTAQSCSLRDEFGELEDRGAVILGASLDSHERQVRFKEEHQLPFELLSDTDRELARAFDSLMRGGLMAQRKTFIIAPGGTVAYRFDSPQTSGHADEVIDKLDELMSERM